MNHLFLDVETFSECDLKLHGTPRYAEHESTEIMVAQWALNDGKIHVEDLTGKRPPSEQLQEYIADESNTLVIHNSTFERNVLGACWNMQIDPERIEDTMIQAMSHSLPGALEKVGNIIGLPDDEQKDKRGKALIQLFCKPQKYGKWKRATSYTHPFEWDEFLAYSYRDIVSMRASHARLPKWNYHRGSPEHRLWVLDQRINSRGFTLDMELVHAAIRENAKAQASLTARTIELTEGEVQRTTQRDLLLKHILVDYGVELPDMKKSTLERRLADPELPEAVRTLLGIRLEASMTSAGKYKAMERSVSADHRVRNTMQFGGAQRTNRWAGRTVQPQNMMRPTLSDREIEIAIDLIKRGCPELMFPNVMEALGNCTRGCIVAAPGKKLVVSDLSNIEGRKLVWFSGEQWKLQAFREFDAGIGADMYIRAYARAFGIPVEEVTKAMRQIGKVMELALGYEGGVGAFISMAMVYKMDLDKLAEAVWASAASEVLEEAQGMWRWAEKKKRTLGLSFTVYVACEALKQMWRDAHPKTTAWWKQLGEAFKEATLNPGTAHRAGEHIVMRRDGAWLRIRLPSGRYMCYLHPQVGEDGGLTYFGVNQYTRQWGRIKTYSGKIAENIVQASSRDVFASSMWPAEEMGYQSVLLVHDENVTETPDSDEYNVDTLSRLMATPPTWASDLPLAAAGFEAKRYGK